MRMHVPEQRPTEAGLWMCPCDDVEPHAILITPKGFVTEPLKTKRSAGVYVDAMVRQGFINDADAERIRRQIAESSLADLKTNDFHVCTSCWIPVKHGHFTINDDEVGVKFSVRGAIIELGRIHERVKLFEDVARIEGQISASGLPETSDIDILWLAKDELDRREAEETENMLTILTTVIESGLRRHGAVKNSPIFPMAGMGTA